MKRALLPDVYLGAGGAHGALDGGAGFDTKTIKPLGVMHTSFSALAYAHCRADRLAVKAKVLWGQNMSDYTMLNGYGASRVDAEGKAVDYTNFNLLSSWVNVTYGQKKGGGGARGGRAQPGRRDALAATDGQYAVYGRGFYAATQTYADRFWRAAVFGSFNLPKLSLTWNTTTRRCNTARCRPTAAPQATTGLPTSVAASVFYHF